MPRHLLRHFSNRNFHLALHPQKLWLGFFVCSVVNPNEASIAICWAEIYAYQILLVSWFSFIIIYSDFSRWSNVKTLKPSAFIKKTQSHTPVNNWKLPIWKWLSILVWLSQYILPVKLSMPFLSQDKCCDLNYVEMISIENKYFYTERTVSIEGEFYWHC